MVVIVIFAAKTIEATLILDAVRYIKYTVMAIEMHSLRTLTTEAMHKLEAALAACIIN